MALGFAQDSKPPALIQELLVSRFSGLSVSQARNGDCKASSTVRTGSGFILLDVLHTLL